MKSNGRSEHAVPIDNVKAIRGTDRALLCRITDDIDDVRELWVPRSQIDDDSEVFEVGDEGQLVVTQWFAEQESLA